MDKKEYQINAIKALISNEETIGVLYRIYGDIFPGYKDFWYDIGVEEIEHANWIRKFRNRIDEGFVYFNERRFNIEAIETFIKYTESQIAEAKKKNITIINALAIAFDIENSVLEKNYFEIFEGDSAELKHIFMDLAEATKGHRQKIAKALEAEKNK